MVSVNQDLIVLGGAKLTYRYAHEPSKVFVLRNGASEWDGSIIGELLAPRIWHACITTFMDGEAIAQ